VTTEQYEQNLRELVLRLKATNAKLIWASTTPVPEPATKLGRVKDDVPIYNGIARKIMDENHIPTDDLYTFALPRLTKIQRPENVHYTAEGYEDLAEQVARAIATALRGNHP
jgi:acyl-CoA thioesterase-1